MSDKTVHVVIKGTDQLSPALEKIGAAAKKAGDSLQNTGKGGGSGLDEVGKAAESASQDLSKLEKSASKVDSTLSKSSSGVSKFADSVSEFGDKLSSIQDATSFVADGLRNVAQATETARRQVQALNATYGEAGTAANDFAKSLADSTRFTLEDTREAMRIMGTLYQNYGLTLEEINRLMETTADLATTTGIDLADAAMRTSSAIRGEAESAEYLGLTLNANSIDREGLLATMSNEEAAHYRLNALYEQAAFAQGETAKSSGTMAGQMEMLGQAVSDAALQLGNMVAPFSTFGSMAADFAGVLPGIVVGISELGKHFDLAAIGAKALALAMSPIGIGAIALGGIIFALAQAHQQAADTAAEQEESYQALLDVIRQLNAEQGIFQASMSAIDPEGFAPVSALENLLERGGAEPINEFSEAYAKLQEQMLQDAATGRTGVGILDSLIFDKQAQHEAMQMWEDYRLQAQDIIDINTDIARGLIAAGDRSLDFANTTWNLKEAHKQGRLENDLYRESVDALADVYEYSGPNADKFLDNITKGIENFETGKLSAEEFANFIQWAAENSEFLGENLGTVEEGTQAWEEAQQDLANSTGVLNTELGGQNEELEKNIDLFRRLEQEANQHIEAMDRLADMEDAEQARQKTAMRRADELMQQQEAERQEMLESIDTTTEFGQTLQNVAAGAYAEAIRAGQDHEAALNAGQAAMEAYQASADALNQSLRDQAGLTTIPVTEEGFIELDGSLAHLNEMFGLVGDSAAEFFNTIQPGHSFLQVASDIETAADSLNNMLAVFEQIQSLGDPAQAAADIARGMVGSDLFDPSEFGTIDQLLEDDIISWDTYSAAVDAANQILADNVRVQNEVNAMQAERLPMLAEESAAYADSVEAIRGLNQANQDLALSAMDATTQEKLLAVETALVAESLGQMPTDVTTEFVLETADSDEKVAAILEQLGIIQKMPDGSWEMAIDISGGPEAKATIDDIVTSVDSLKDTLIDVALALTGDEEALESLRQAREEAEELDGKESRVKIVLDDTEGKPETLQGYVDDMDELDGKSASPEITLDDIEPFGEGITGLTEDIGELDNASASPEVEVHGIEEENEAITALRDHFDGLNGATANPKVEATVEGGEEVEEVVDTVEEADGKKGRIDLSTMVEGQADAKEAVETVEQADGKTATMTVKTVTERPVGIGPTPVEGGDVVTETVTEAVNVEAKIGSFDTSLIDDYEPPDIQVDAKVVITENEVDTLTGANSEGGAATNPSYTVEALIKPDTTELDALFGENVVKPAINPVVLPETEALDALMLFFDNYKPVIEASVTVNSEALTGLDRQTNPEAVGGAQGGITIPATVDVDTSELDEISAPEDPLIIPARVEVDTSAMSSVGANSMGGPGERGEAGGISIKAHVDVDTTELDALNTSRLPIEVKAKVVVDDSALDNVGGSRDVAGGLGGGNMSGDLTIKAKVELDSSEVDSWSPPASLTGFDGETYTATLEADNQVSGPVAAAAGAAESFASASYVATLTADNQTSGPISAAAGAAETFATTYTATLAATGDAEAKANAAKTAADAVNATFTASLEASDAASSTISAVSTALDNLNGKTATVNIQVNQSAPIPAMMHGGISRPDNDVLHAAHGRSIMVGEAGPEMVQLPFGSLVQPHGASMSRLQQTQTDAGARMVSMIVEQLRAGEDDAREAGERLSAAVGDGLEHGMGGFPELDPGKGRRGWVKEDPLQRLKPPKFPEGGPPKEPGDDASEEEVKRYEKRAKRYENQYAKSMDVLEERISKAQEQVEESTSVERWKKALDILGRLEQKKRDLEAEERKRQRQEERAAEAASKASESASNAASKGQEEAQSWQEKIRGIGQAWKGSGESATGASESMEQVGDATMQVTEDANQASGAIDGMADSTENAASQMQELADMWDSMISGAQGGMPSGDQATQPSQPSTGSQPQQQQPTGLSSGAFDTSKIDEYAKSLENLTSKYPQYRQELTQAANALRDLGAAGNSVSASALNDIGYDLAAINGENTPKDIAEIAKALNDVGKAAGTVQRSANRATNSLTNLGGQEIEPSVALNTKEFDTSFSDVTKEAEEFEKETYIPDASLNRVEFDRIYNQVTADVDALTKEVIKPSVEANKAPFDATMKTIENGSYSVDVEVNYVDNQANDAPAPKLHGGQIRTARHGRAISDWDMIPHAAMGRTVLLGEVGPELVHLPYGSLVQPHGASMSRIEAQGGANSPTHFHYHGPVTFVVPDGDVAEAVYRQQRTQGRV